MPQATAAPAATPAPPRGPVTITDAEILRKVEPNYPEMAKEQQIQGTAIIEVTISPSGQVVSVKVYQSSGSSLLDNEALRAARLTVYKPPSVETPYLIEYVFKLE